LSRQRPRSRPALPSFPTRRSSDLSDAADGRQRWQVEIPGSKIRAFDAAHGTLAVVTESPGHNPYVPWPGDARGEPVRVTVVDAEDRKSTRLNSSHVSISYAVFCLK